MRNHPVADQLIMFDGRILHLFVQCQKLLIGEIHQIRGIEFITYEHESLGPFLVSAIGQQHETVMVQEQNPDLGPYRLAHVSRIL